MCGCVREALNIDPRSESQSNENIPWPGCDPKETDMHLILGPERLKKCRQCFVSLV